MHGKTVTTLSLIVLSFFIINSGIFFHAQCLASEAIAGDTAPGNVFILQTGPENAIKFQLGGIFETDYRFYTESERADNRFLIRRAQMEVSAWLRPWLKLNLEYEFKSDVIDHLMDTYAQISFGPHDLRVGHFKKPFSLEVQNGVESVYFAERSMGKFLSPGRDVGAMFRGSFAGDRFFYSAGLFNAEGEDVENRGDGNDSPEAAGRIVCAPFAQSASEGLKYFQIGASGTYAKINLGNLNLKVKTAGMVDTSRNIYVLGHDTKFGVLQEADDRWRLGAETAWAFKSLACQAEYIRLTYASLKPAGRDARDADFSSWYVSMLYFITGEQPLFQNGTLSRVIPIKPFSLSADGYGAIGISARYDHFEGDEDWINPGANVSVRKADSFSLAVTWIMMPMSRVLLDYTYTDLSDPIRVRVKPDGSVDYIDTENVITLRYTIDF